LYQVFLWKRPGKSYAIRTKKDWMISTIKGRNATITLLASDTIKSQNSFEIKSLKEGFHLIKVSSFCKKGTVISANKKIHDKHSILVLEQGKRFLFLGNYLKIDTAVNKKLPIDYLVVQKAGLKTLENALAGFEPKEIWVDWSKNTSQQWNGLNPSAKVVNFKYTRFRALE